jgi:hypothetical protein
MWRTTGGKLLIGLTSLPTVMLIDMAEARSA